MNRVHPNKRQPEDEQRGIDALPAHRKQKKRNSDVSASDR